MTETMTYGPLSIRFDDQVLRPRPWTLAQSEWAAELSPDAPAGPVLELCAGVGHIGLALAALTGRDLVLVDANPAATRYAEHNARTAGLPGAAEVRTGLVDAVLEPHERFALVVADPPWVRSDEVERFPEDPLLAIDGGDDGLDIARTCVDVIAGHLLDGGAAILQLGNAEQAAAIAAYVEARPELDLAVRGERTPPANGILVWLGRRG